MDITSPVRQHKSSKRRRYSHRERRPSTAIESARGRTATNFNVVSKKGHKLEEELNRLRDENKLLRISFKAVESETLRGEARRYSEKRRSESLVNEVDRLQRCCARLSDSFESGERVNRRPRTSSADSSRLILDLVRSNQSLYRRAVFSMKQRILTEQKLLRRSSHSREDLGETDLTAVAVYSPMIETASKLDVDFAEYLISTGGYRPERFLGQFADVGSRNPVGNKLTEFIGREFVQLALWTKRVESIVSDIESLNSISSQSIDSTLAATSETIRKNIGCEGVSIWMIDNPGSLEAWTRRKRVESTASKDETLQYEELRVACGAGLVGDCFKNRIILNIPDAYSDPRFDRTTDLRTGVHTRSVLCVPIIKAKEGSMLVVSVIQAINKVGNTHFSKQDEIIVNMFGSVASSVVNHFELLLQQENESKKSDLVVDCIQSYIQHPQPNLADFMKLTQRALQRLFHSVASCIIYASSDSYYTRLHFDGDKLSLCRERSKKEDSLTQSTIEQISYIQATCLDLHPAIDVWIGDERGLFIHSFPVLSGGAVQWIVQFATREKSHFSRSSDLKHLLNLTACMTPYMKRLIV